MPGPTIRRDDLLHDEAKAMLGRTPAQSWLRPERVELSARKHTTAGDFPNPYSVEFTDLEFVLDPPWTAFSPQAKRVKPNPDLLERFLRLAAAPAPQIHRFASRFGALLVFCRTENRKAPPGKLVVVENCEVWRYFAASMRSLLRIASTYQADRRPDPADWDRIGSCPPSLVPTKERPRDPLSSSRFGPEETWIAMAHFVRTGSDRDRTMWARLLNVLLELGRVRPWLVWERTESAARPKLMFSGRNLLSYLALQLCLRASKHDSFAVCSYCEREYTPTRRAPKAGQRNFCPDCRDSGVPVRLAQRSRRDRLRQAPLAGT
jgi:hypothetical protein